MWVVAAAEALRRPGARACSGAEPEEAEYAWLPIHCLKPFEPGDAAKHAGLREGGAGGTLGGTGEDANLSACVGAAERALAAILAQHAQRAADDDEADSAAESDSDGGAQPQARPARPTSGALHFHVHVQAAWRCEDCLHHRKTPCIWATGCPLIASWGGM